MCQQHRCSTGPAGLRACCRRYITTKAAATAERVALTFFVKLYSPGTADTSCPALSVGTALSAERAGLQSRSQSAGRWKPRGPDIGAVLG